MLSCSIWFSVPSFWTGGGLESRFVGPVYVADGAVRLTHGTVRNIHTTYATDDGRMRPKHVELRIYQ